MPHEGCSSELTEGSGKLRMGAHDEMEHHAGHAASVLHSQALSCPSVKDLLTNAEENKSSDVPGSLNDEAQCWELARPVADHRSLILNPLAGPVKLGLHTNVHSHLTCPNKFGSIHAQSRDAVNG